MKNKLLFAFAMLLMVVSAVAQTTRIKLTQIEKANTVNGTKANQVPVSNGVGDLRYSQYVEINPTNIGYTPSATGNPVANYSQFVRPANNDIWYIDGQGQGIRLYVSASAGDYDWLEIGNNQIPNSITDSIYKYKYASVGGRVVYPRAEFLVVDSAALGLSVVSGFRVARIGLYDNDAQTWGALHHGAGNTQIQYQTGGAFSIQTSGGTLENQTAPFVEHFVINNDSSIRFPQYPSTRLDSGTPTVVFGPDATGKMKNYPAGTLNGVVTSGPLTGAGSSLFPVTMLNSGVTPGAYTSANVTVDAFGRVTAAANGSGGGGIGGTIAANQVAVGSGANTIGGSSALTFTSGNLSVTGNVSVSGTGRNTFSPTVTTTASGDYGNGIFGSITGSGTVGHRVVGTSVAPLITAGANNQVMTALEVSGSYTPGAFTGTTSNIAAFRDAGVNKVLIKPDSFVVSTPITITLPTLTGSSATNGIDLTQVWNTTGTVNGIRLNITNTASAFASALLRLNVGGAPVFQITPNGAIVLGTSSTAGGIFSAQPSNGAYLADGRSVTLYHNLTTQGGYGVWAAKNSGNRTATSGETGHFAVGETFAPTSGTAVYNSVLVRPTINQTGTASGISRGLLIDPVLTAATDFRAIETTAGKVVFWATNTPAGTTSVQTINKTSGSINMAAGTLGINVNNSLVTANSIIICTVQTNDATAQIKNVTPGGGVFTINLASACTAETKIGFVVFN